MPGQGYRGPALRSVSQLASTVQTCLVNTFNFSFEKNKFRSRFSVNVLSSRAMFRFDASGECGANQKGWQDAGPLGLMQRRWKTFLNLRQFSVE